MQESIRLLAWLLKPIDSGCCQGSDRFGRSLPAASSTSERVLFTKAG